MKRYSKSCSCQSKCAYTHDWATNKIATLHLVCAEDEIHLKEQQKFNSNKNAKNQLKYIHKCINGRANDATWYDLCVHEHVVLIQFIRKRTEIRCLLFNSLSFIFFVNFSHLLLNYIHHHYELELLLLFGWKKNARDPLLLMFFSLFIRCYCGCCFWCCRFSSFHTKNSTKLLAKQNKKKREKM